MRNTLILIAALLVLAACTAQAPTQQTGIKPGAQQLPGAAPATTDASSASGTPYPNGTVINITAFRYSYDPDTITLKGGDTYTFRMTSKDTHHGLAVPQLGIQVSPIEPGQWITKTFTIPNNPGTYTGFCDVFCGPGHRSMKMTVVVA